MQIIGEAEGVVSGVKLLKRQQPDLLFLNVQLRDGTGFDVLELLPDNQHPTVIFTTVSDAHAIRAFRFPAVDYLLKPIALEELKEAVDKASRHISRENRETTGYCWMP